MLPVIVGAQVRAALEDYLETTFRFTDPEVHRALFAYLSGPDGLFKGPYVDLKLPFRKAGEGETPPLDLAPPFRPYVHQLRAMTRLSSRDKTPEPTLVVTGTGSGKTECFLYPILDHCLRHAGQPGIKAIILYPMNALASDQARRIAQTIAGDARLRGQVSAGLFIGGVGRVGAMTDDAVIDSRGVLKQSPPDILLTNYRMLDFLLLRPEDRTLWAYNEPDTLRYLVLDELHTYDGAQGSDVACLVRRLRARLGASDDAFACVGTSATVGAQGSDAGGPLREFASALFGVTFDKASIIGEDRSESHEAFPPPDVLLTEIPQTATLADLDFRDHDTLAAYVDAQSMLWFGTTFVNPVALGDELARHALLRRLLIAAESGIQTLDQLTEDVASMFEPLAKLDPERRLAIVQSWLALVARARRRDESGRTEPLVAMQAQLWVRELRRLMRRVPRGDAARGAPSEPPFFAWHDELDAKRDDRALPIVHCRACGASGFGAVVKTDESPLEGHPGRVGEAYLRRHKSARFLLPGHSGGLFPHYLCAGCLRLGEKRRCFCGREDTLRVVVSAKCSAAKDGKAKRFMRWCPACETNGSLRILGARAPSLSSVATTQLYASGFNEDKKLLAFTDSVQDASHLAGFFGARTYRFAVRTALLGAVAEREGGLLVSDAAGKMLAWAREKASAAEVLAALVPSDLRELREVKRYAKRPTPRIEAELTAMLSERLAWEATMEVGYNSLVGRSLERCGSIVAHAEEGPLAKAVHILCAELAETRPVAASSWDEASVRRFVEGVVYRLRTAGGILHPFLRAYIENEGASFHLSKRRNPLMSPYSPDSVPFKFFTTRGDHDTFESLKTDSDQEAWVRDWAVRALGLQKQDQGINLVYEALAKRLVQAGVLAAIKTSKGTAFGLEPSALRLTSKTALLACDACHENVLVPAHARPTWEGAPCVRFRCHGHLAPTATKDNAYYSRLYRATKIAHIATAEHTGLLSRPTREKLETRFKTGKDPFAPNLLVCTPTLEMGIDIGDLSATMLCSTPRAPASYVQRVGRAGRKTGNALVLSIAEARAHDLYFFTEPIAMMRGEVTPPGCFLDAPEILRRQVVAFGMDAWSRQATSEDMIPRHSSFFFRTEGATKVFPGRFLTYYRENHEALLAAFFARFDDKKVTDRSRARLTELAHPDDVTARIEGAYQGVREEHDELRRLRARLDERIEALKKEPVLTDELTIEKRDAEVGRRVLHRMMGDIERKYPLNVLTDAGVLPNYAFPEPGVTLRSAIRSAKKAKADGTGKTRGKVQTFEYLRPASAAIRELAPFSTFYAEGRKVRITQIDVGTTAKPLLESWRFCRACAYALPMLLTEAVGDACPKCHDALWPDAGQLRRVVHMKRVSAVSDELASAVGDESEDREMVQYEVMDLVEIDDAGRLGARLVPDMPFGWELLTGVTLREINFGPRGNKPATLYVNGQAVQSGPFVVCADCGQVEEPLSAAKGQPMAHASFCSTRKGTVKEKKEEIFLYRSVQSEAIRVLLPVAFLNADRARATFQAALELGLRRKFRGNPTHILFKTMTEPLGKGVDGRRTFLVLYDGVPGGTGYLAELARDETLLDVLALSLEALQSCSCKSDPDKDGCYRCLLAYQAQRDFDSISRTDAIALLSQILAKRATCQKTDTLSNVRMDSRVESELEALFLNKLAEWATSTHGAEAWEATLAGGREAYLLTLPSARFRVELQVELGAAQGIDEWQRADFVIRPLGGASIPPICIYTDGLAYHVRPDQPTSELPDDLRKRRALVESGNYAVFSLTWKEVHDGAVSSMWSAVTPMAFEKLLRSLKGSLPNDTHVRSSFSVLTMMLENPTRDEWEALSRALAIRLLPSAKFTTEAQLAETRGAMRDERARHVLSFEGAEKAPSALLGGGISRPHAAVLATWPRTAMSANPPRYGDLEITLRLYDEPDERQSEEFETSWMAFLHAFNVLQWHPNLTVLASSELEPVGAVARGRRPTSMPPRATAPASPLDEALALSDMRYHALLRMYADRGLKLPEMGDVADDTGRVLATVDLFFVDARVVVSEGLTGKETQALGGASVLVLPHREGDEEALIAALRERERR